METTMIHITLGKEKAVTGDGLGRSLVGYREGMTAEEVFQASRGCWRFGARADREKFAIVSHGGRVLIAIEIDELVDQGKGRRAIEGRILKKGHPVHDRYVGKPSPVPPMRNPITYFPDRDEERSCACGCGEPVTRGDFLSGHDQKAIHERVARVGSVVDFLEWFDATFAPTTDGND